MTRNFEVFVDLRHLGEGTHTVDIQYAKVPSELSVYIEPKTIEVEIEERASEEFDVDVDFINIDQLPEGYELGVPDVNPGKVRITSSRSVIDEIAIVKVYIDVAGKQNQLITGKRSEEHTSELQSRGQLVCRLLLEKKKRKDKHINMP